MTVEQEMAELFDLLVATYPTPYPVTLRWQGRISYGRGASRLIRERGIYGDCYRIGRRIVIRLSRRRCRSYGMAVNTLLHEYAHAMTTRHDRVERHRETDHDDEWALAFGRVYRTCAEWEGIAV